MTCKLCHGEGSLDVLNVWAVQREHIEHGQVSIDSASALPMLKNAVRCPECQGSDACDEDMEALKERMGGNPYDEETYR